MSRAMISTVRSCELDKSCSSTKCTLGSSLLIVVPLISMLLQGLTGCAAYQTWRQGQWEGGYDAAQRQSNMRHLPILIHYSSAKPGQVDPLTKALSDEAINLQTKHYVRCRLYHSLESDRRFMGQFSVTRSPALVVLRTDGTYHAAIGLMTTADIRKFLSEAKKPGILLKEDNNLAHRLDYAWMDDLGEARLEANRNGQAMLVVYRQRLTNQWRQLQAIFEKQEVSRRMAELVHCRVDVWSSKQGLFISPFGVIKLPAIVLVDAKGTYDVLEQPMSFEAVARFADRFLKGAKQPASEAAVAAR